jgi:hypothetical protein
MATAQEIEAAKDLLPPGAEDYGFDEDKIAELLDAGTTGNAFLVAYWDKVATDTADLVDMSESGSSRSLSQIHKNALSMAKTFRDLLDKELNPAPTRSGIRSGVIRRV